MSSHGAKNLILLSRSGPRSPASRALLSALTANGTSAATPSVDIGDRDALSAALSSCLSTMPPIRGCVQAAMSLHIIPFAHESSATLARALDPKVAGSWNLHTLLPADVDFFVMLSSLAATVGQQATPAYNMGCAYQDGLAQYRAARGLHGVSLALGPMLEDGYVVEAGQAYVEAKLQEGFAGMSRVEFEALLGWHCDAARARPGVGDAHVVCGLRGLRGVEDRERGRWYWKDLPLVKSLWELEEQGAGKEAVVDEEQEKGEVSFKARVEVAMSWAEVAEAVLDAVRGQVAKTMGVGPTEIEVEKPLIIMGVDSLMAVEIKNFLWKSVGVDVSVLELLNNRSVKQLCAELARRSDFAKL
jgi:aryl carrier-like protein